MSDIITLKGKLTTKVDKSILIPSFYKEKYDTYIAILSKDIALSIYPHKKHPTINIMNPDLLIQTHHSLDEPMEEDEFWRLYNETKEIEQRLVTPHIPQP